MTRILIVDDHPVIRRGLREIIAEELPTATIGEAGDYPTALQQLHSAPWELVLLDINLPGRNGLELLEEIRRLQPRTRVLMVSAYPEEQFAVRAPNLSKCRRTLATWAVAFSPQLATVRSTMARCRG